jgi:glycosyltransferase involved in cell wall biosynthesis
MARNPQTAPTATFEAATLGSVVSPAKLGTAQDGADALRVLYLTTNPNLGASSRVLQDWLVLSPTQGMHAAVVVRSAGALKDWLEDTGVAHLQDPMPWPERRRPWHILYHAWRVARFARSQKAQVIQCYEQDLYPFALMLRRLLRLPLICHMHFVINAPYAQWLFGARGRKPDAVIWTTRQHQQDGAGALAELVPADRQHVIYSGLSLTRFGQLAGNREAVRQAWGVKGDDIVVGAACALRARKRVDDFLGLTRGLTERHANVFGVLAGGAVPGDEAYAAELTPKLRDLESTGRFRWLGHLEPIEPFMHAIDILVGTSEYETFGNTVVEAMACRRPVAAYQGGSIQEVLGDVGLVVANGDLTRLTEAVEQLVQRPLLRQELGQRGRQRVEATFNPAKTLEQLKRLYSGLAAARG